MLGFSFNGVHIKELGLGMQSVDRNLLPSRKHSKYNVLGIDGEIIHDFKTYHNKEISVTLYILPNTNFKEFREKVHQVADFLSGKGKLIFDDEPEKVYDAVILDNISLRQLKLQPNGIAELSFECAPFCYSKNLNKKETRGKTLTVENKGNKKTCFTIELTNVGTSTINNINLTIKGRKK